jgi:hypothetical protein
MRASQPDYVALAVKAGEDWAEARASDLRREGRPVEGGWPGTIKEGMTWVLQTIGGRVAHADLPINELRALARTAYGTARTRWLALQVRE